MLRRTPMKRTGWPPGFAALFRDAEREKNARVRAQIDEAGRIGERLVDSLRAQPVRATYAGSTKAAVPKPRAHRNRRLLDMAHGQPCLLMIPDCCNHRVDTTVACHANLSIHGKGGARKADDQWTVFGCAACHRWLDSGPASAERKADAFHRAHALQVLCWRQMAGDASLKAADRRAAQWALDRVSEWKP